MVNKAGKNQNKQDKATHNVSETNVEQLDKLSQHITATTLLHLNNTTEPSMRTAQ